MQTSKLMQNVITKIAEKHGFDLTASSAHLRLEMPPYEPLVIEKVGKYQLSVAHYTRENGDTISDPDVVFFTGNAEWVAIEISQWLGYNRAVNLSEDGTKITTYYPKRQRSIAQFVSMWARNIQSQGWLKAGVKSEDGDDAKS